MKKYIQIGANIGNDDFQKEIEALSEKSFILLVEPNPKLIDELKLNYKLLASKHEIAFLNKAITTKDQEDAKLYIYQESGHSSLIRRKSHMIPLEEIGVDAIKFNTLCEIYNIDEVELLQIDTEGLDYEIVNSIEFSKIKIHTLIFECWGHPDDDLNKIYRTGADFLEKDVKNKLLELYDWGGAWLGNMPNHKLTLKK
jgi:FkbM family methyltransferase